MVGTAVVDLIRATNFMSDDRAVLLAKAQVTLTKVLSLAANHASAHLGLGALLIATNRAAQGIAECERALALDHNLADAHAQIGIASKGIAAQFPCSPCSACAGMRRGNVMMNSVNEPGSLTTSILPPCCFTTISWLMDNPSPVPSPAGLVVKNGLKIFSRIP